ncbi:diguanylate cyclase [Enterovibrio norvegicus FF-33]|uniref:diguanylate cyclase n=1 Tax=Enterovibrio norvegicus FF-454 TaxID=1185651 RepID=A0A1E5CB55_9GAMM|nr:diguanylate cyclase [Enterovibrio norvegicus]OEE62720.1 diguanylate cyclase [Enterovibrio norvegicus FF-454]OEE70108.1 diguanylate cyclase [Enterovibrio norvegicus FF-33]OEE85167.1 diguanylate cyclase [Enterovibrio norvegicus FF-162]
MIALDYAFCLKVGEAICPQKDLNDFCLALGLAFTKQFTDARSQLLINDENHAGWQQLADIKPRHFQLFSPMIPISEHDDLLLTSLLTAESDHLYNDVFNQLIPLKIRGSSYGYLLLKTPHKYHVDRHALEMLSLLISGALDSHLQHHAFLLERSHHQKTEEKRVQEVCSQKGLLEQLHILHKISLRLWHSHSLDNMLHTAVYECIHALDFDRMAIFLLNSHTGLMRGTYGTDINGTVTNEQWYCTAMYEHYHAKTTLDKKQHININEGTALFHDNVEVGKGWNATISLWDGDEPIGWIACDNLITHTPLKSYHSELLKLLGVTMSQHLIQRRSQDELKLLNLSLEQRVADRTAQLEEVNKRLNQISREDSLTKVPNRRMLDEKMEEEWRRAMRYQTPLSILIVDIDHFKQYNDLYGHALGDKCLAQVAKTLSQVERRAGAILARFGGEEFVFLLPGSNRENAKSVADRALDAITALQIPHDDSPICPYVTVSIGGKTCIPDKPNSQQQLFIDADVALYEAKSSGKNQAFVL